jgi:uncharacterized protein YecT (DUF1311 family)
MRTMMGLALLSGLTVIASATVDAQAPGPQTAEPPANAVHLWPARIPPFEPGSPAQQACETAMHDNTNKYVACLQQTLAKYDASLAALMKQIPPSDGAKANAHAPGVAPSGKKLWQTNFAALTSAFRVYRDKDCADDGIAEAGYGMGGMEARLECQINETSRQIQKLKERYGLK